MVDSDTSNGTATSVTRPSDSRGWMPNDDYAYQLIDNIPRRLPPESRPYGLLKQALCRLIQGTKHLQDTRLELLDQPGIIPPIQSKTNFRIPALALTKVFNGEVLADTRSGVYKAISGNQVNIEATSQVERGYEETLLIPVAILELASVINLVDARANLWMYTTIGSINEILLFRHDAIEVVCLRRNGASWIEQNLRSTDDVFEITTTGSRCNVGDLYGGRAVDHG